MEETKEVKAICKICKVVIFSYPEPYKKNYDTGNFCCLSCYIKKEEWK